MHRIIALIGKAIILASVVAVMLPMPHYARSLAGEQYVVWLARLAWVLLLTVGSTVMLLLIGLAARWLATRRRPPHDD